MKKTVWLVSCVGIAALGVTVVPHLIVRNSGAFPIARSYVLAQPEVGELGDPVDAHLRLNSSALNWGETRGQAELVFDVEGQQGNATAHVELKKQLGEWSVTDWKLVPSK